MTNNHFYDRVLLKKAGVCMNQEEQYEILLKQAELLIENETDQIANMANLSALLMMSLENINWAGFYLYKEDQLILGPFQGKPACIRIPLGRGVCGTAAATKRAQCVKDVHQFPGHIACDSASRSEIVVPILTADNRLIGVLDIDAPIPDRFEETDIPFFTKLAELIGRHSGK